MLKKAKYAARLAENLQDVHSAQALRCLAFNLRSETGLDQDRFDDICAHMLIEQMPMNLISADSSLSVKEPAAYGIILFDDQSIIAHTEDYEIARQAIASSIDAMPDKL